ncbi:MAG TPA: 3-phosphoserine/phosphohydroxythreonine transaminase [Planctomycetes bacterium]|nr:3-phosphoserine/phosphohydroxythreonine transaminase [Planctomycetota bacterium]
MSGVHNFNPGPAVLPAEVLEEVREEMFDFKGTGISILETSHRSKEYQEINDRARSLLLELLGLGDEYEAMFLQGGASLQFAQVPMNLLGPGETADYVVTGAWSAKALKEAKLRGKVNVAADTKTDRGYTRIPRPEELKLTPGAAYVHVTTNNTISGTQWHELPDTKGVPLVVDASSDCLWKPHDYSNLGLLYAGAQKNLGPAGATAVVIRKDLLDKCGEDVPIILRYKTQAEKGGLYNTPSCFAVYVIMKVLEWVKARGGAEAMERSNREKAELVYGVIDKFPQVYSSPVEKESRSYMNVVWHLPSPEKEAAFLEGAARRGMIGLKGHRSVGGCRASLYNSLPVESARALAEYMEEFAATMGT